MVSDATFRISLTFKINGQPTIARFKYGPAIHFRSVFVFFVTFISLFFILVQHHFMFDAAGDGTRSFREIIWRVVDVHERRRQKHTHKKQ